MAKQTGLTEETGWQIGVRRTLSVDSRKLWDFLLSPAGIAIWLGEASGLKFEKNAAYQLDDGTVGQVRVMEPYSHWRITRQPPDPDYQRPSTIQVRVMGSKEKCVLAFHEEHLPSVAERQARKTHYLGVIEKIRRSVLD